MGLAIAGLIILAPVLLTLLVLGWVLIGSPVFTQTRVGQYGRAFTLIKFRTMPEDTPDLPTHMVNTQEIPLYGRILRKTRLDETPQLINVILGEMSLVGPRPCLPQQHELLRERASRGVTNVRPGITGLAQICGIDMSMPRRLARYDELMLKRLDLVLYFSILVFTVLRIHPGRRNYVRDAAPLADNRLDSLTELTPARSSR